MTVRIAAPSVSIVSVLFFCAVTGSCRPTGGSLPDHGAGGQTDGNGGAIASGGAPSAGGALGPGGGNAGGSPGSGGIAPAGGRPAAGGAGRGGSAGAAGASGRDAAVSGAGGAVSGRGGASADARGPSPIDSGPVACDDTESAGRLGVYYYDDAAVSGQAVQMHFDIVNYTAYGSRLSQVTVRYWFTDEVPATPNTVEQYYVPIPTKMTFTTLNPPRVGADTVLEMSFSNPPDAGVSWVETRGFNFAFHKASYNGTYDQSNDYSYDPKLTKTLGPNPHITAYVGGVLAWGCEPPVATVVVDASAAPAAADASTGSPADGGR